ncbi:hypothetical protein FRB99_001772 [Tulasnella sp. 403]|nr:hypothetical protein FRB99_001772 [Tulasnella sp. 403]
MNGGTKALRFPVVSSPNAEQRLWQDDPAKRAKPFLSINDSLVMLQSLNQSRQMWLKTAFAKFKATSVASGSDPQRSAHTISTLGTCDLEVGPHVFPETKFFEVTYPQVANRTPSYPGTYGQYTPQYSYPSHQTPYTYPSYTTTYYPSYSNQTAPIVATSASGPPLVPTVASPSTAVSPPAQPTTSTEAAQTPDTTTSIQAANATLINQIDAAAAKDPYLGRLILLAAEGKATPAELDQLAGHVQKLRGGSSTVSSSVIPSAATPSVPSNPALTQPPSSVTSLSQSYGTTSTLPQYPPTSYPSSTPPLNRETPPQTDIILQFSENQDDQFTLPLNYSIVERVITSQDDLDPSTGRKLRSCDVIVSTVMPPASVDLRATNYWLGKSAKVECHPVTIRLVGASSSLWLGISKKTQYRDEVRLQNIARVLQDMLSFVPKRVHLQHQLPEGSTVNNLRAAAGLGLKRKESPDPEQPKRQKYFRPSGLQVEVVVPPPPNGGLGARGASASNAAPSTTQTPATGCPSASGDLPTTSAVPSATTSSKPSTPLPAILHKSSSAAILPTASGYPATYSNYYSGTSSYLNSSATSQWGYNWNSPAFSNYYQRVGASAAYAQGRQGTVYVPISGPTQGSVSQVSPAPTLPPGQSTTTLTAVIPPTSSPSKPLEPSPPSTPSSPDQ